MKKVLAVVVLAACLMSPALAGDIEMPAAAPTPTPTPMTTAQAPAPENTDINPDLLALFISALQAIL